MSESDVRDAADEMFEQREYWKKRCEAAEYVISALYREKGGKIRPINVIRRTKAWIKIKRQSVKRV